MQTPAQRARRATVRADGTPVRVTRRRAETRARLLDAAFSVFAAQGFGGATIEDVCAAAGYTRGAFYSNFDTLDELFFALYQQRAEVIATQVAGALEAAHGDLRTSITPIIDSLVVDREWVMIKTEFLLHAARNPAAGVALRDQQARLRLALASSLQGSIDVSGLPEALQTAEALAEAVMAVHDGVMERLVLHPDPDRLRTWLADLLNALLR
jgi:AcrR family transcriptional regulator